MLQYNIIIKRTLEFEGFVFKFRIMEVMKMK
jgi:hypothetical protein